MANFCSECGAALVAQARFCSACGTVVASGPVPVEEALDRMREASVPEDVIPHAADKPIYSAAPVALGSDREPYVDDEDQAVSKRRGLIWAGVAVIALAVGGGAWMGISTIGAKDEAVVEGAATKSAPMATAEDYYAIAKANLRDKPDLTGSKIIGSLERGERVRGITQTAADGRIWLKLEGSEQYVSLANLSKSQPPILAELDGSDRVVSGRCQLLEAANSNAAVKASLPKGAEVKNFGRTADGYVEFGMPGGGVGYVAPNDACMTAPSAAKGAVANQLIKFNPIDCDFGPEMRVYLDRADQKRAPHIDSDSLEEVTAPVDKIFHGLRVTDAISGYEWHGVAFAEPVDKVKAVFRKLGYRIADGGDFQVTEETPVVSAFSSVQSGSTTRGKTALTCGV